MLNITGRYVTVFNPEIKLDVSEHTVFANLNTSRKDNRTTPPTYKTSSWLNARFVGEAFEPAKALRNKDKIDIIRGAITNEKSESNGKFYNELVIFEFALSDLSKKGTSKDHSKDELTGSQFSNLNGDA